MRFGFNGWLVGLAIVGVILAAPIIAFVGLVAAELALVAAAVYIPFLVVKKFIWPPVALRIQARQAEKRMQQLKLHRPELFMSDREVLDRVRQQIRENN